MTGRPHCRKPDACAAKGDGHCRSCIGTAKMAELLADPARVAARLAKSIASRQTEEHRAHLRERIARQRRDPKVRAAMNAAGRRNIVLVTAKPGVRAKMADATRRWRSERLAAQYGIPAALVAEFRRLRRRGFPPDEVVDVLRASYPASFSALDAEIRAAAMRSCGPAPAIGMPERAAWSQQVAAAVAQGGRAPA